jgi:hypothetical protein
MAAIGVKLLIMGHGNNVRIDLRDLDYSDSADALSGHTASAIWTA